MPDQTHPEKVGRTIDGKPVSFHAYCRELIQYREVAYVLIGRDLIIRFRHTYFGVAWLLFKPLMLMVTMTFAFGHLAGFAKEGPVPYPLIIFCGVIPWYFFSNAVPDGMGTLSWHMHILQKTYFPRAIFPLTAVTSDAAEFLVAWLLFAATCIWYGFVPDWRVIFFPLLCIQLYVLCVGIGLGLSVINVRFRDISNLVPFLLSVGFLVSPVGYTLDRVPQEWQLLYALNPMVGIIEGLRWSLLNGLHAFPRDAVLISIAITALVGWMGTRAFLANELDLVDFA